MESNELKKLEGKNWVAAMTLCWFLGSFGAHRFYTGKTNSGWIMLGLTILGCSAPVSAIWAIIDGVMIALGHFTHEDGSELYERIPWFAYLYLIFIALSVLAAIVYVLVFLAAIATVGTASVPATP